MSEVDLIIADYIDMLTHELSGRKFNKTEHRKAILSLLNGRSPGSVERKHQNISAVMIDLGLPYVSGYKPLGNFQALLYERMVEFLVRNPDFFDLVRDFVDRPAALVFETDFLSKREDAPAPRELNNSWVKDSISPIRKPIRINYLEREARNASLGKAGEVFVLEFEKARLHHLGLSRLATRVEHVSETEGDGLGFDIRSFEANGDDRLIEVKTTAGGKQTPFFVSWNEVQVSQVEDNRFYLYRVFDFRRIPRLFSVQGALDKMFRLETSQYIARIG
jgi:hypothetical protein